MLKVQKWGNSLGIRVPKAIANKASLHEGSEIELDVENGNLVIKPASKSLDELLSQITPGNLHAEIPTGQPKGRESW